ncbi:hypothetical protein A0H81_10426 [Grifola frondosa]|uniref:Uncharacterized protein n=1 Tax=Grifola frondosa TaxID=5627 RepID=A0A1C7LYF8_GRIFR|nr:hypothetical protein A0H81_10426 [Grifola frondosa]
MNEAPRRGYLAIHESRVRDMPIYGNPRRTGCPGLYTTQTHIHLSTNGQFGGFDGIYVHRPWHTDRTGKSPSSSWLSLLLHVFHPVAMLPSRSGQSSDLSGFVRGRAAPTRSLLLGPTVSVVANMKNRVPAAGGRHHGTAVLLLREG